jgi:ribonuclease T2
MLNYMPTASLISHEWTTHGTCSGLNVEEFFYLMRKARDSIDIPEDIAAPAHLLRLSPKDLVEKFAAENKTLPTTSIRATCNQKQELQEVRICLNRDLSAVPCGPSAGMCPAPIITLPPVR